MADFHLVWFPGLVLWWFSGMFKQKSAVGQIIIPVFFLPSEVSIFDVKKAYRWRRLDSSSRSETARTAAAVTWLVCISVFIICYLFNL